MKTNKEQKRIHLSLKLLWKLQYEWQSSKKKSNLEQVGVHSFLNFVEKEISTSKK